MITSYKFIDVEQDEEKIEKPLAIKTSIKAKSIDHMVLTVKSVEATCRFYKEVLGMEVIEFGPAKKRKALQLGCQKINLHAVSRPIVPHAKNPTPGSADLCILTDTPIIGVVEHLKAMKVDILEGPVTRTGAIGPI